MLLYSDEHSPAVRACRLVDEGNPMARHADDTRRRGIAGWLVATVVGTVVAVALLVGYLVFLRSDAGTGVVATGCTGSATIDVAAGASQPAIAAVADAYNATKPAARGTCLTVAVSTVASATAAPALVANWANQAAPPPAVWIADSSADVDAVAASDASIVAGHTATPVATSPVVLAVRDDDAKRLPAGFSWKDLPAATDPDRGVQLAEGKTLTLALGDPRDDLPTASALESMVAATGGNGGAVSATQVGIAAKDLRDLTDRSAHTSDLDDLLDDLAGGAAAFTALPALEAHVAWFDRQSGSAALRAVYPAGQTTDAQLLPIALTAGWLDQTELEGASAFLGFLRSDAGLSTLRDAGWRVPGAEQPAAGNGIDRTVAVTAIPASGEAVRTALARAIGLP